MLFILDTYAKARKACLKAEEDSAIDTAAGETDIEKCRKRRKPARYQESDNSEIDNFSPKKSKNTKYSFLNDSSDTDISTADNIQTKVKTLLKNRNQSPSLLTERSKTFKTVKRIVSPSCRTVRNVSQSQSSSSILQNTCYENKENSAVKSLFIDGMLKF